MSDYDEDLLRKGLADLLAKNDAGELLHRGPADDASHDPPSPSGVEVPLMLPRVGLLLDGKRQLTRCLGSGSFGTVYEARQLDLDRLEAIKFLHERWMTSAHREVRARFLEESRVMASMRGTHLVEVYDSGTLPGGLPYFVMERLEGKTLRARLQQGVEVSLAETFEVAVQILEGLCEVHDHAVIHRDIKPENIFLAAEGVKLLDFGLAKTSATLTTTDAMIGTPLYMAPELITGQVRPDARTDLYAASVVLYELLVGEAPFRRPGMGRRQLEDVVLHEVPAPPSARRSGIPTELEALILAGLGKRPEDRPRSANEMLERLREVHRGWLGTGEVAPELPAVPQPVRTAIAKDKWPGRRRRAGLAAAVALLGGVGLAWLGWPPLPDLRAASGGVLVTRPYWASHEVEATYDALCDALGGDEARASDAVLELPAYCVPLSSWNASSQRLEAAGNAAHANVVVHVEDEVIRLHVLDHGRRLPLLEGLPTLELPTHAGSPERIVPVLQALLRPDASPEVELPVLDPERDGFHWTTLAEALRRYHGHEDDPEAHERLERLARCDVHGGASMAYCNLARLLHALSLPCERAIAPLREVVATNARSEGGLGGTARIELARCLVSDTRHAADAAGVLEAERLIDEALRDRADDACARASVMGTVSRIAVRGGDRSGALQHRAGLDSSEYTACPLRTMVARELAERAYVLTTWDPPRWCDAAKDGADAHQLQPGSFDVVVNWAEAHVHCSSASMEERVALLQALELERFERGPARVSVAFMRWLTTRDSVDAHAVVASWDDVGEGMAPLIAGVAATVDPLLCEGREQACAPELLRRPKDPGDRVALRRTLGLDGTGPPL